MVLLDQYYQVPKTQSNRQFLTSLNIQRAARKTMYCTLPIKFNHLFPTYCANKCLCAHFCFSPFENFSLPEESSYLTGRYHSSKRKRKRNHMDSLCCPLMSFFACLHSLLHKPKEAVFSPKYCIRWWN